MTTTLTEPVNGALAVRPADPMAIIQAALERGVDHDQLGKLLDLQERHERHRAAETFGDAVADFQRRCPPVHKGRKVASMGYVFASYDDVMAVAGSGIKAGLAIRCGATITAQLRIFAGLCLWRLPSLEEREIRCRRLEGGTVAFGDLVETAPAAKEQA